MQHSRLVLIFIFVTSFLQFYCDVHLSVSLKYLLCFGFTEFLKYGALSFSSNWEKFYHFFKCCLTHHLRLQLNVYYTTGYYPVSHWTTPSDYFLIHHALLLNFSYCCAFNFTGIFIASVESAIIPIQCIFHFKYCTFYLYKLYLHYFSYFPFLSSSCSWFPYILCVRKRHIFFFCQFLHPTIPGRFY